MRPMNGTRALSTVLALALCWIVSCSELRGPDGVDVRINNATDAEFSMMIQLVSTQNNFSSSVWLDVEHISPRSEMLQRLNVACERLTLKVFLQRTRGGPTVLQETVSWTEPAVDTEQVAPIRVPVIVSVGGSGSAPTLRVERSRGVARLTEGDHR